MFLLLLLAWTRYFVLSDLPIHCLHYQVVGKWKFQMSDFKDANNNCGYHHPDKNLLHFNGSETYNLVSQSSMLLDLRSPNEVYDEQSNKVGEWTMVYDEGVHVQLYKDDITFFSFMKYEPKNGVSLSEKVSDYVSYCDTSRVGWVQGGSAQKYGCYKGQKFSGNDNFKSSLTESLSLSHKTHIKKKSSNHHLGHVSEISYKNDDDIYQPDYSLIETINNDKTKMWTATVHKQFIGKKMKEMSALLGRQHFNPVVPEGHESVQVEPAAISFLDISNSMTHPSSLDWRNYSGINFMNPVRNQKSCGSCYALATVDVFATRFNIELHKSGQEQPINPKLVFSPQDILSCSSANQGCTGGYPFLVGKYGKDIGFIAENCLEYTGRDKKACSHEKSACPEAKRYKLLNYKYIGGFYGACNELRMIEELQSGPIVIAFDAEGDLFSYSDGIYHCAGSSKQETFTEQNVRPWEKTTHAVVGVGYGTEKINNEDVPYWLIKNSWGANWGQDGYFKVKRGVNTCAVESMAVSGTPMLL